MPNLSAVIGRFTDQTVVYWAKLGPDGYGKPTYDAPIEIPCRWESRQRELVLPDGRLVRTRSYFLLGTAVVVGGVLFLGTLEDVQSLPSYPAMPTDNQGGYEILTVSITPGVGSLRGFVCEGYV